MSHRLLLAWGVLSVVPLGYKAVWILTAMKAAGTGGAVSRERIEQLQTMHAVDVALNVLVLALLVSFLVYLFRTEHVTTGYKALWAVVLFLGNIVAMPVFWYIAVWRPIRAGNAPRR